MKTTYVIGHKKPDTDSVCAAISYAYLKNKMGLKAEARMLGIANKETRFVLDKFGFNDPAYLNDVKVQIRSMKYSTDAKVNEHVSIEDTFNKLQEYGVTGLSLVNDDNKLSGYVNVKEIANYIIKGDIYTLKTSYSNILKVLDGTEIFRFNEEVEGKIIAAAYKSKTFTDRIKLNSENILIVADRESIIDYAINSGVKLLIIVGNNKFPSSMVEKAKANKVSVISTPYTTYLTANKIKLCNYIQNINVNTDPIRFTNLDYRDDFIEVSNRYGHTNYPIVDKDNNCLGMLRLVDQNNYDKRNIILVDHNQAVQSVDGIEEANILEIVDHHNLGTIGTAFPIAFRSMPVGCTCTVIYQIYKENNVEIPKDIAGLMLSAILSDTMILKSPTTTDLDIDVANNLAKIAALDIEEYGLSMLRAGSSIKGMNIDEIIEQDFKSFKLDDGKLGIGQVMTLDFDEIKKDLDSYIAALDDMCANDNYKVAVVFVTDVLKDGSYIIYNTGSEDIIAGSYGIKKISEGMFIPGMVSRKKQMYPQIDLYLNQN